MLSRCRPQRWKRCFCAASSRSPGVGTRSRGTAVGIIALSIAATGRSRLAMLANRRELAERKQQAAALDRANLALAAANRELESFSYSYPMTFARPCAR